MILRLLHARLAAVLFLLLLAAGAFNLYSTLVTSELYLREVNQTMNLDLAAGIAKMKYAQLLDGEGEIRRQGVDELLHWMMVVNPGPHFYIVDLRGNILEYDKMAGELLDAQISLMPVREFLDQQRMPGRRKRMVLGDDPREPGTQKVFSASPLPVDGPPVGFLYIILDPDKPNTVQERVRESFILKQSARNGLVYLAVVLVAGLLIFGRLIQPVRQLTSRIRKFRSHDGDEDPTETSGDDVALLESTFDAMALRIESQMDEIERMSNAHRELIANVSHDLRTPIASLRGYLDTMALKNGALSKEERDEYLQIALRQSERLGRLVQELFELTKLDAREVKPQLERFKIAELVQDNVQRFQLRAMEKGVQLNADFDPDLPPVRADIGLMERALENLIENAIRFTPAGGSVTLVLREDPQRVEVKVVDTGVGISAADLPYIFDRYYRSRSGGGPMSDGAGLGLAITRRIVELHDSELAVASTEGVGTTVAFSLAAEPRTHQLTAAQIAAATRA